VTPYLLTFAVAILLAVGVTPLLRVRAGGGTQRQARGAEEREPEKPRVGGLIIFAAFASTPIVASLLSPTVAGFVEPKWPEIAGLFAAAFLVFLLGYLDDLYELAWYHKTGAQVAASVILYALGYRLGEISVPGGGSFTFGPLDLPATIAWMWLVTNAVNLIDGHDGVAAGVTALTAGAMAVIAWDLDHFLVTILFASLAGAVLGFLPFNFPAASRFLGDSGAQLLGFLLAALAISGFIDETGRIPLYIPIIALAVPLLDIGLAFSRRLLNGHHPFHADLDHVHHRIERMLGYGPRRLALALYGFSALFAVAALGLHALRGTVWVVAIVAAVVALVVAFILRLGYHDTVWQSLTVQRVRGTLGRNARLARPAADAAPCVDSQPVARAPRDD
jgi:UDP-GlcNAc:undecaprenyl-phosphate/decaprenyl-phosphate GlcNAc-1-phosphate transferase